MPELPEIETIKKQLQKKVVGKKIKAVEIRLAKMIQGLNTQKFKRSVVGASIQEVWRRAKLLVIKLTNSYSLVIHLKLTGQLIYVSQKSSRQLADKSQKYVHFIYYFNDGTILLHYDLRQFGWVKLIKTSELEKYFSHENFGPEPFKKNFTLEKFQEILSRKLRQRIKPLLMDQTFIAGIGNVYAQEVCFCAKILPIRTVKTLTENEIENLYNCLMRILKEAIRKRGTSVDTYVDAEGKQGNYAPSLKVYNRENKECFRCQTKIKRIALTGRGTYFCPHCQK